jgi:type IV secretory pathway TrbD component
MLPDPGERLVLHIGSAVTVVPNDDPRRAGLSIGHDGSLALAADNFAIVLRMSIKDWLTLCEVAMGVASALAQRDPALAPIARLAAAEVAGHA